MVALIRTSYDIRRILTYNENKVKMGIAECIGDGNYPSEARSLSFSVKLSRFLKQLELNPNVIRNSVHISLNFVPAEAILPQKTLLRIAERYMQKIGFGDQPYLIYQHLDAGHPHLHLVSINVRADGSRINMFHLGRTHSVKACREIEHEFGLVVAHARTKKPMHPSELMTMRKITYGQHPSTPLLAQVLTGVLECYRMTSLSELNALLGQYKIVADRGPENMKMFKKGGLVYRILGPDEKPIGAYIRASDLPIKATLTALLQHFKKNETLRVPYKSRITRLVDTALLEERPSLDRLINALADQGIHVALHRNKTGLIDSITYVDHQTKCVFSGTSLGQAYRAEAIQNRCLLPSRFDPYAEEQRASLPQDLPIRIQGKETESRPGTMLLRSESVLPMLLQHESIATEIPQVLINKRRRKKLKNRGDYP